VERQHQRDLEILAAIGEGQALSQRALAQRLGVALGLTNLLLKRLAKKGYIKIAEFPKKPAARKRFRYLLTPKGIQEKMRLSYDHAAYSLVLYRRARQTLRDSLALLSRDDVKRVALVGTGEAAELAYLTLRETGIEPIGVFTYTPNGPFLGIVVQPVTMLSADDFDAVVLATFDRPEAEIAALARLGIPARKILTLRQPLRAVAP
jgi:DNA-binding MarR family transcriptional regulator